MALVDYFNVTIHVSGVEESIAKGKPIIDSLYKAIMDIKFGIIPRMSHSERKVFSQSVNQSWIKKYK